MQALPLSGNPPSVVTSFSLQTALQSTESSSFSPSLGSLGVSSVSTNSNTGMPLDTFGYPSVTIAGQNNNNKERSSGWVRVKTSVVCPCGVIMT